MGRPLKLSDQNKDWFLRRSISQVRSTETRELRKRFLIVCEGTKTEPRYFESIKRELPRNTVQVEISGEGCNTLSLISRARKIISSRISLDYPFDQVWVVFDRDSFKPDDFDNAIKSAEANGMHCAWSNGAFELWYILHFEYRNTGMSRTEYQGKLSDLLGEPYCKNAPDMYQKLKRIGNQIQAVARAKRLQRNSKEMSLPPSKSNPCTTVSTLIEELNRFIVQIEG